jgi:hypothetical protein
MAAVSANSCFGTCACWQQQVEVPGKEATEPATSNSGNDTSFDLKTLFLQCEIALYHTCFISTDIVGATGMCGYTNKQYGLLCRG